MQDQAKRMKYIRMKTFKKGTEEREDLLVAYQNWAVKVAQEKEKRLQEVIEERRRKLKEEYFKEQAKKQRKKGFLGIKNLVKKHITELKTTNTALVNSESEPQIQQPQEVNRNLEATKRKLMYSVDKRSFHHKTKNHKISLIKREIKLKVIVMLWSWKRILKVL